MRGTFQILAPGEDWGTASPIRRVTSQEKKGEKGGERPLCHLSVPHNDMYGSLTMAFRLRGAALSLPPPTSMTQSLVSGLESCGISDSNGNRNAHVYEAV